MNWIVDPMYGSEFSDDRSVSGCLILGAIIGLVSILSSVAIACGRAEVLCKHLCFGFIHPSQS